MKTAVNTYSFLQLMKKGQDIFNVIEQASSLGFTAIEFTNYELFPKDTDRIEYAKKIKEACDEKNLEIVNYATGANFLSGELKDQVEALKIELQIVKELGCSKMRHDTTFGPDKATPASFDMVLDKLAEGCLETTKYAEQLGILTMTENHGFFSQDSERVEKLICKVNHKNFRTLLDIGNFLCADEQPEKAVARMLPFTAYVHVKDFHFKSGMTPNPGAGFYNTRAGNYLRGAIIGHGDVPVYQILKQIKNYGYDDALSIEFEGLEESVMAVRIGKENIERFWNM